MTQYEAFPVLELLQVTILYHVITESVSSAYSHDSDPTILTTLGTF